MQTFVMETFGTEMDPVVASPEEVYPLTEYEVFLKWSYRVGISWFTYHGDKRNVTNSLLKNPVIHFGRLFLDVFFLLIQIIFLLLALRRDDVPVEVILIHCAWISGPMYGLWPFLSFLLHGNEWCSALNEIFAVEEHILGEDLELEFTGQPKL